MHRINLLSCTFVFTLSSALCSAALEDSEGGLHNSKETPVSLNYAGLFSAQQMDDIMNTSADSVVHLLLSHKIIKFSSLPDVVDFAAIIEESGYDFFVLEPRIVHFIKKGERIFTALDKAITRERFHQWHGKIVTEVSNSDDDFVTKIETLSLTNDEKRRMINVYATCIVAYTNQETRTMLAPKLCDGGDDYKAPRHAKHPVAIRTSSRRENSVHNIAYQSMLNKAKIVANDYNLNTFERIMMAKCIAEQSLRFFNASANPLKALHKHRQISKKAPEEAFFMHSGVCSNFSGISEDVVTHLGLDGKVFLAKRPAKISLHYYGGRPHLVKQSPHIYLEFEEGGTWYHAHPFSSKSEFPILRFPHYHDGENLKAVQLDEP